MIRHSSQEDVPLTTWEGGTPVRGSASVIERCYSFWEESMSQTR